MAPAPVVVVVVVVVVVFVVVEVADGVVVVVLVVVEVVGEETVVVGAPATNAVFPGETMKKHRLKPSINPRIINVIILFNRQLPQNYSGLPFKPMHKYCIIVSH